MSELLPCPFCSGAAFVNVERDKYWVECRDCASESGCCRTVDEAVDVWNTRYERTCHAILKEPRWAACECSVCGGALESFNKFCPNCGARVVAVDERTCKVVRYDAGGGAIWLTCSECGNIMPEHDNYCSSCCARVVRE